MKKPAPTLSEVDFLTVAPSALRRIAAKEPLVELINAHRLQTCYLRRNEENLLESKKYWGKKAASEVVIARQRSYRSEIAKRKTLLPILKDALAARYASRPIGLPAPKFYLHTVGGFPPVSVLSLLPAIPFLLEFKMPMKFSFGHPMMMAAPPALLGSLEVSLEEAMALAEKGYVEDGLKFACDLWEATSVDVLPLIEKIHPGLSLA